MLLNSAAKELTPFIEVSGDGQLMLGLKEGKRSKPEASADLGSGSERWSLPRSLDCDRELPQLRVIDRGRDNPQRHIAPRRISAQHQSFPWCEAMCGAMAGRGHDRVQTDGRCMW